MVVAEIEVVDVDDNFVDVMSTEACRLVDGCSDSSFLLFVVVVWLFLVDVGGVELFDKVQYRS